MENYQPTVMTITLNVFDNLNDLSLATALYNWYKENKKCCEDIDLLTVINLLHTKLLQDAAVELRNQKAAL